MASRKNNLARAIARQRWSVLAKTAEKRKKIGEGNRKYAQQMKLFVEIHNANRK